MNADDPIRDAELRIDGDERPQAVFIFAHGAGAGMDTPFMAGASERLIAAARAAGLTMAVIRFEFDYMTRRRVDGGRRPPDRPPKLLARFCNVVNRVTEDLFPTADRVFIGGKSMGGRMATLLTADKPKDVAPFAHLSPVSQSKLAGVLCLGYPFHPPGKPDSLRIDHFPALKRPALICQGTRDPFGTAEQVDAYPLPQKVAVHWIEDGDHDLKPRKKSGRTPEQALSEAATAAARFFVRPGVE